MICHVMGLAFFLEAIQSHGKCQHVSSQVGPHASSLRLWVNFDSLDQKISHLRLLVKPLHQVHVTEAEDVDEVLSIVLNDLAPDSVELSISDSHHVVSDHPHHNVVPFVAFLLPRGDEHISKKLS